VRKNLPKHQRKPRIECTKNGASKNGALQIAVKDGGLDAYCAVFKVCTHAFNPYPAKQQRGKNAQHPLYLPSR
jgi:hypothetical protein